MKLVLVLAVCATLSPAGLASDQRCDQGPGTVTIRGEALLAQELRQAAAAKGDLLLKGGTFSEELFDYLGCIAVADHCWHVVYLSTTWGESCRATHRLLVFDSGKSFLGQYAGFQARPDHIEADSIVLVPQGLAEGGRITFTTSGPPAEVYIDGEILTFFR